MKNKSGYEKNRIFDTSTIILWLVIFSGIIIRLYYIPYNLPISLDAVDYFAYAVAMSREGVFPDTYLQLNFGWSSLLSLFFFFTNTGQIIDLMNIQRIISVFISTLTLLPLYFLCKIFFKKEIAILGTSLFIFEPRIIENAITGLTDPLFILLTTSTILFIFYKNGKFFHISFVCAALAAFVRYEGILLLIPILFAFFFKLNKNTNSKKKLAVGVVLFLTIVTLVSLIGYESGNQLGDKFPIIGGGNYVYEHVIEGTPDPDDEVFGPDAENRIQTFFVNSTLGFLKYIIWVTVPISIVFVIIGLTKIIKKPTKNRLILLMFIFSLSIAGLYAYGRGIEETRYVYSLIPIVALIGCFAFDLFFKKYNYEKLVFPIILAIIISSTLWLEYNKVDNKYEAEIFDATLFVVNNANGVNTYDGAKFVRTAEIYKSWPDLPPTDERGKIKGETKKISPLSYETLREFIIKSRSDGLTHLVVTSNNNVAFLDDVFTNEDNYTYLIKVYDSKDHNFRNQIKVYKINFEFFERS